MTDERSGQSQSPCSQGFDGASWTPEQITPSQHSSHFGRGRSGEEKERRELWVGVRVFYPGHVVGNTGGDLRAGNAGVVDGCRGNRCSRVLSPRDDVIAEFRGWL